MNTPLISFETLKRCYQGNSHGMGLLYVEKGNLKNYKELTDFTSFYDVYKTIHEKLNSKSNIVIHFRLTSHGAINYANLHPFYVDGQLACVHNGIIYGMKLRGKESDTSAYTRDVLRKLPKGFLNDEAIIKKIENDSGWSKFIFLNRKNEYTIIREETGIWENEIWFSNMGYKDFEDDDEEMSNDINDDDEEMSNDINDDDEEEVDEIK
jgi:predicted glutamine amidotransferase